MRAVAENRVTRLKGILNTISLRKNSQDSLILTDASKLPNEFWRVSLTMSAAEW
ncbi:MAG: hypothetical protein JOY54_01170 [Acidobacteriaceae bacterium]|nr:hypothetical protein [Acidobacteriaceae bacterium]